MAQTICSTCGRPNPPGTQICEYCGARIEPPLRPGEGPVKKVTTEFEKVSVPSGKTPIRPGETPTKKDTGELEKALPTWLQSVRKGEETPSAPAPDSGPPAAAEPAPAPTPEAADAGDLPDWLAGLKAEADEDEELPEWLAGIRSKIEVESSAPAAPSAPLASEEEDWFSRLAAPAEKAAPAEGLLEWLSPAESPGPESPPPAAEPDWLARLKEEAAGPEPPPAAQPAAMPDWLTGLPPLPAEKPPPPPSAETPEWLKNLEAAPPSDKPSAKPFKTGSLPPVGEAMPDWLAKLQAEAAQTPAEEFRPAAEPPKGAISPEAVPDWLSGVREDAGPPVFIEEREAGLQAEAGVFAMEEQPDWLSMLKPEAAEAAPAFQAGAEAAEETPEGLERAELPSWVQAMRPVESVVADVKTSPLETDRPPERDGPLAGLRGVLPPASPPGALRKPPAYSIKLQVEEGQQAHAARLERIVASEAEPQPLRGQMRLVSARLLRWVIALILLAVVGGTIGAGGGFVPPSRFLPTELTPTMNVVGGLPANSPLLLVFDYQPALAAEMEAAAAPLVDHLLLRGARLTLLSTSPTGPALAERFLKNTQAHHHYQAGQQYVNLGYLAGGPAGILDFAQSPSAAAPYTVSGQPAWQTPPLQGVRQFGDFAAVVILTDDPDIGRMWIEQAGPLLGKTPMLMVISAQAEPMIRPYYDSGQLKGLVCGLAGGKAYGQATNRPGPAGDYWDAFSVGILAAELLIAAGAVWGGVSSLQARRADRKWRQA